MMLSTKVTPILVFLRLSLTYLNMLLKFLRTSWSLVLISQKGMREMKLPNSSLRARMNNDSFELKW